MGEAARIHPTAIVEDGVSVGSGTVIWDNVHMRAPSGIGRDCIVGEKTYVAYDVEIGDRVKLNAFVYVCAGVTIEEGVMVSAGVVFTNDRYPRATTSDLDELLPSEPASHMPRSIVRRGATIGAGAVIGPGVEIGEFAMAGMGAVVTRSVSPFHLVAGNPARTTGYVCKCGRSWHRTEPGELPHLEGTCSDCGRVWSARAGRVEEKAPDDG